MPCSAAPGYPRPPLTSSGHQGPQQVGELIEVVAPVPRHVDDDERDRNQYGDHQRHDAMVSGTARALRVFSSHGSDFATLRRGIQGNIAEKAAEIRIFL